MGRNATSKIGVNDVTGRGYNPSVKSSKAEIPAPFGRVHFQNMYAGAARYLVLFITLPGEYSVRR